MRMTIGLSGTTPGVAANPAEVRLGTTATYRVNANVLET